MVAYMTYTKSHARALHYNEHKVEQGKAAFIHAEGFLIDKERLTTDDKTAFLKRHSDLNTQLKYNTLHAKLLFHPDERLSDGTLAGIADQYMASIGFKDQPYLVYRHDDAGEQHLHIVSSLITESGKRIEAERQPWAMSVQAAQAIEKEYGLKRGAKQQQKEQRDVKPAFVRRIKYGEKNIIRSVGEVVKMVTKEYKFTSLEELNALLRPYNIYADRCLPGSHTYQHRGLYYRVLDEEGKNRCTPIKSSVLYGKPGLKQLEKRFLENQVSVREMIPFIKSRIDWIRLQEPENLTELAQALKTEGIDLIIGKGEAKYPDLFYVDHQSRSVVSGRTMGKDYCAEELFRRFPDSLKKHLPQVPHLLSQLTEQLSGPDAGQTQYQNEFRIKNRL
jgi:Relaxase/Mobilisation nuclease domain